jgi:hypothetical protein
MRTLLVPTIMELLSITPIMLISELNAGLTAPYWPSSRGISMALSRWRM